MRQGSYQEWIEAFAIFAKYEQNASVVAGYKEILAGPYASKVSDEDKARLNELGWEPDGELGIFRHA